MGRFRDNDREKGEMKHVVILLGLAIDRTIPHT